MSEASSVPVGKTYDGGTWTVDHTDFEAYAAAIDDPNPAYRGPDGVAPPMFHVRPFIDLMMQQAKDPELDLDLLRLVHAGHDVRFHRLLRHGEVLSLHGELHGIDLKSSGKLARFGLVGRVGDEKVLEADTSYFIRGEKKADGGAKKAKPAPEPPPAPDLEIVQQVTADQATRYAHASGDHNPIHVDPETAKKAGLPGVILHGLCTMAFAQRDLVDRLADGDPHRLRRLGVRFAAPVFPGQPLTLKVWRDGHQVSFVTENSAGRPVIVGGRAELAPQAQR